MVPQSLESLAAFFGNDDRTNRCGKTIRDLVTFQVAKLRHRKLPFVNLSCCLSSPWFFLSGRSARNDMASSSSGPFHRNRFVNAIES